ncbi:MAG: hypothetical protein JW818_18500 [Pirellulales bacterium]|nr:hypothetical protein [Pirellulales bacterium]
MKQTLLAAAVVLGMASGPANGAVLYGPLMYDNGIPATQGGPYVTAGPQFGTTDISFDTDTLTLSPTQPGHGMVHDTGFTTTRSTYTITSTGQWNAMTNGRYSLCGYAIPGSGAIGLNTSPGTKYTWALFDETDPDVQGGGRIEEWTSGDGKNQLFFQAGDQTSGDGVSAIDFSSPHNLTLKITDTGNNATSTFTYTWTQEVESVVNTWIAEETFENIRSYAVGEAQDWYDSDPYQYFYIVAHVEDLFDSMVTAARSSVGDTGFAYYVFSSGNTCSWDNTTVTDGVPSVPGDTNGDGNVNSQDARKLAQNWLKQIPGGGATVGDFNGDGWIDDLDASILAANWTGDALEGSAVPEPWTGTLLASLVFTLAAFRAVRSKCQLSK